MTSTTSSSEKKPTTRPRTFGSLVGSALTKLTTLNEAEAEELAGAPDSIRKRYADRRSKLLSELEPAVRQAVLAASSAATQESAPRER